MRSIRYAVDFDTIKNYTNTGYIFQPNTSINQPLIYSQDKEYYLTHTFDNKASAYGAIRVDSSLDSHLLYLYGRNNRDNISFGALSEYTEPSYYHANPSLYILSPNGDYKLDIFAGVLQKKEDLPKDIDDFYNNYYDKILKKSYIKTLHNLLPDKNEDIAILISENYQSTGRCRIVFARKRPICYVSNIVQYVNKFAMDTRISLNKILDYKHMKDVVLYAQNDPIWKRSVYEKYESPKYRPFGDGGCGPTSIANAIVNIVPRDKIRDIEKCAKSENGFSFCSCSVNEYFCYGDHIKYRVQSNDEYLRYLPLVIANISTGNNIKGILSRTEKYGSNLSYLPLICDIYGIELVKAKDMEDTINSIKQKNCVAVASVNGLPFTRGSHFLTLLSADSEYVYLIDSLRRSNYGQLDPKGLIKIITPGLIAIRISDIASCGIASIYLLKYKK